MTSTVHLLFAALLSATIPAWAAGLLAGPMLGHATSRTASVWLQTDQAAQVELEFWPEDQPQARRLGAVATTAPSEGHAIRLELLDLEPGRRYRYSIRVDGQSVAAAENLQLRTLPHWHWRRPAADFTLYLGSCAYLNDPPWDRPGRPYGDEEGIFARIAEDAEHNPKPHLMLWLGDNLYFREVDLESPWAMDSRYRQVRASPSLARLLRATRHYAIWDDHDYGPNNGNRAFVHKADSLRLFRRYWANPSHGQADLPGIYTHFAIQDADIFLLDDRYYRASDHSVEQAYEFDLLREAKDLLFGYNAATRILGKRYDDQELAWLPMTKTLYGEGQLDWLRQALLQSTATFKIIAGGSQFLASEGNAEGWHHFPREREAFLTWLEKQGIQGVLFLSGDRHHSELLRLERKDAYPLHELTCSPLTAGPQRPDQAAPEPRRVPGSRIAQRNYCVLDVSGPKEDRRLQLSIHDSAGHSLWRHEIQAGALRDPLRTH